MIKVAIAGGTGYTAGELIRILINHPEVEISSVISSTSVGTSLVSVHRDLTGETDIKFTNELGEPDVIFLCLGHGLSKQFIEESNIPKSCKIIDLGNDFRLEDKFGDKHFTYGLSELNREKIIESCYIANPGCFATSILLGITPLIKMGQVYDDVHISAVTGSTGSGKKPSETGHFSYRDSNLSIYKLFTHQHLGEIRKTLEHLSEQSIPAINFVPFRGDFTRGIFSSIYTKCSDDIDLRKVVEFYKDFYKKSPFVHISEDDISLKEVVNTNKCFIQIQKKCGQIHISSIIDNLIKGASGQAVQNMNLMFGFKEDTALKLKASAF